MHSYFGLGLGILGFDGLVIGFSMRIKGGGSGGKNNIEE